MRFSLALLAATAAVVNALPHTVSTGSSMLRVNEPIQHGVEARDIKDTLGGLKDDIKPSKSKDESSTSASSSTPTSTSATTSPSSTTTTTSSSSSAPTSSKGGKKNVPQNAKSMKYKGDDVTVIHNAGTDKNKTGFKWTPENPSK